MEFYWDQWCGGPGGGPGWAYLLPEDCRYNCELEAPASSARDAMLTSTEQQRGDMGPGAL